jgi:hypothetical protein
LSHDTSRLTNATVFLGLVAALSTAVQAWVAFSERDLPLSLAIHERLIESLYKFDRSSADVCLAYACLTSADQDRRSCLSKINTKLQSANDALDELEFFGATETRTAWLTSLDLSESLRKQFDAVVKKSNEMQSSERLKFEDAESYESDCFDKKFAFIRMAREKLGLKALGMNVERRFVQTPQ